jgi:chromosome partitioning protein
MRIIAFANQKGGVAKTTTVSNLASELASRGLRVLMIDMDPQSSLSMTYGARVHEGDATKAPWIYDLLMNEEPPDPNLAVRKVHDVLPLHLIPSGLLLSGAEMGLFTKPAREHMLKESLHHLRPDYDYVLIDCPPALNLLTLNALVAAHFVVIPVECEFYGLDGISLLMKTITQVQKNKNLNPALRIGGVIPTKLDQRKNMHIEALNTIMAYEPFKNLLFNFIPTNAAVAEASSRTSGYTAAYDKTSAGANAFRTLANLFLRRFPLPSSEYKAAIQGIESQAKTNEVKS